MPGCTFPSEDSIHTRASMRLTPSAKRMIVGAISGTDGSIGRHFADGSSTSTLTSAVDGSRASKPTGTSYAGSHESTVNFTQTSVRAYSRDNSFNGRSPRALAHNEPDRYAICELLHLRTDPTLP